MVEGQVIKRTVKSLPDNPEARFGAFLSTFNTELKSATVLALRKRPLTSWEIKREAQKIAGSGWVPSHRTFSKICEKTLFPIGFVAEEFVRVEDSIRVVRSWGLSDLGETIGVYLAKFAIKTAVELETSLAPVLGVTHARRVRSVASEDDVINRAPYNRARILMEINKGARKEADLRRAGISGDFTSALESMREFDLIEYESVNPETRGWAVKVLVTDRMDGKYVHSKRWLTAALEAYRTGPCSALEAYERLKGVIGTETPIITFPTFKGITEELERKGNLRSQKYIGGEKLSDIVLKERGRAVLEFVNAVYQLSADLDTTHIKVDWDQAWVGTALDLYRPFSGEEVYSLQDHNRMGFLAWLDVVSIDPSRRGIRPREYSEEYGFSRANAANRLNALVDLGLWEKIKARRGVFYRPKSAEEHPVFYM